MRPLFVSYRRRPWQTEVLQLSLACRRRGLRTLVDVSDPATFAGANQLDALRETIRDNCDGLILYFTRNIAESPAVWNVEIPAALDALDQGDYTVLPIFRDISPADASDLPPHGARLAAMGGVLALPDDSGAADITSAFLSRAHAEVAREALATQLRRYRDRMSGRRIEACVRTRLTGVQDSEVDLVMDWTQDFEQMLEGRSVQEPLLREALRDLTRALAEAGIRAIRLHGPAHLSAAVAFGHAFNRATGFQLEAVQRDSTWSTDGPLSDDRLRISTQQINASGTDVLLILALSRPEVIAHADATSGELGLPIGGRILVQPNDGPGRSAVADESHARAIVKATTDTLMRARAEWRCRGWVHLFVAAPFALAALLGYSLNAFTPIQLYEERAAKDGYVKTLALL